DDSQQRLIPAEYNSRKGAAADEGWPTILHNQKYLPAPTCSGYFKMAAGASVFRCPSGLPAVYSFDPTSRSDPEGAKAWPYISTSTGRKFFIDCWYGINGSTGTSDIWPFTRVPLDNRQIVFNSFSKAASVPRMPAVFDGFWILNGKDERVNARHAKQNRSNLLFFDNSAATFDTFKLPSVKSRRPSDIHWRLDPPRETEILHRVKNQTGPASPKGARKQKLLATGAVLAIVASGLWLYWFQFSSSYQNVTLHQAVGEIMAEETARVLPQGGKIIVVTVDDHTAPELKLQIEAFQKRVKLR